jgi:hypothetical protein
MGADIAQSMGHGTDVAELRREIEALRRENLLKDEIISLLKSKS